MPRKPARPSSPSPTAAVPAGASLSRAAMEAREDRDLAPYAMRVAASRGRVHAEPEHPIRPAVERKERQAVLLAVSVSTPLDVRLRPRTQAQQGPSL